MIADILPSEVASAEAFNDGLEGPLYPEEAAQISRAVESRRREFTTARLCARRALARLGLPPVAVPPGPLGEPRWPVGVLGSITHSTNYRAAAVARTADVLALGIDVEPDEPLPEDLLESIASPDECARLRELRRTAPQPVNWGRLLFSAKESVYKAWFPQGRRILDFFDADLTFTPEGTFRAHLLLTPLERELGLRADYSGRWLARGGLLLTSVVTLAPVRAPRAEVVGAPQGASNGAPRLGGYGAVR
ncbi:4'-phosphopantetheinyl transferase family protein [Streptomyces rubellomurinus]|uniref:4'-phosphopantetheinyl transferase family protein n=1 Tax=Streptomyces rubellomurinus (strain ATCC 31215) TaxID=359131 RepID=UPI0007C6680A|nr:4'-phosphopantetheinyl transferase superfamily protein [Streptomyces rubellomurinus]